MNNDREIGRNFYWRVSLLNVFFTIFSIVYIATSHRFSSIKYEILLSFIALKP